MPLLKTVSRISNWPFHASRKMQKHLHVHRKKQAITFHVKMLRLNRISQKIQILFTFRKTYKYDHYKSVFKHFT